jgi:hypothetical protein
LRVAGPVVHPHIAAPRCRLCQLVDRSGIVDIQKARARGQHVAAARGWRDRPHMPVQGDGVHRLQRAVEAGPAPVQGAAEDVDPQQLAAFGVPSRPLAQHSRDGRPRDRDRAALRSSRAGHGCSSSMTRGSWPRISVSSTRTFITGQLCAGQLHTSITPNG